MSELTVGVNSTETLWTVDEVPDSEFTFYTVGSEIVEIQSGAPGGDPGYAVGQTIPATIRVRRATNGTTAASHLSGAALTAANAFAGGGGGLTVDNTVDPPSEVTTLIAAGATIAGEEATLTEGLLLIRSVTLTDAQIKALVTTDIEIVPEVAVGQIIVPVAALIYCNTNAGAYTNIDAAAVIQIQYTSTETALSPVAEVVSGVTDLIGAGGIAMAPAGSRANVPGTATLSRIIGDIETSPLELAASNGAAGDFTGGNAANSMIVTVFYTVVDLP